MAKLHRDITFPINARVGYESARPTQMSRKLRVFEIRINEVYHCRSDSCCRSTGRNSGTRNDPAATRIYHASYMVRGDKNPWWRL